MSSVITTTSKDSRQTLNSRASDRQSSAGGYSRGRNGYGTGKKDDQEQERLKQMEELMQKQIAESEKHKKLMQENAQRRKEKEKKLQEELMKKKEAENQLLEQRKKDKQSAYIKYLKDNSKDILENWRNKMISNASNTTKEDLSKSKSSVASSNASSKRVQSANLTSTRPKAEKTEKLEKEGYSKMKANAQTKVEYYPPPVEVDEEEEKEAGLHDNLAALDLDVSKSTAHFEKLIKEYQETVKHRDPTKDEKPVAVKAEAPMKRFMENEGLYKDFTNSKLIDSLDLGSSIINWKPQKKEDQDEIDEEISDKEFEEEERITESRKGARENRKLQKLGEGNAKVEYRYGDFQVKKSHSPHDNLGIKNSLDIQNQRKPDSAKSTRSNASAKIPLTNVNKMNPNDNIDLMREMAEMEAKLGIGGDDEEDFFGKPLSWAKEAKKDDFFQSLTKASVNMDSSRQEPSVKESYEKPAEKKKPFADATFGKPNSGNPVFSDMKAVVNPPSDAFKKKESNSKSNSQEPRELVQPKDIPKPPREVKEIPKQPAKEIKEVRDSKEMKPPTPQTNNVVVTTNIQIPRQGNSRNNSAERGVKPLTQDNVPNLKAGKVNQQPPSSANSKPPKQVGPKKPEVGGKKNTQRKLSPGTNATRDTDLDVEEFIEDEFRMLNKEEHDLQTEIINLHKNQQPKIKEVEQKYGINTQYKNTKELVTKQPDPLNLMTPISEEMLEDSLQRLDVILIKHEQKSKAQSKTGTPSTTTAQPQKKWESVQMSGNSKPSTGTPQSKVSQGTSNQNKQQNQKQNAPQQIVNQVQNDFNQNSDITQSQLEREYNYQQQLKMIYNQPYPPIMQQGNQNLMQQQQTQQQDTQKQTTQQQQAQQLSFQQQLLMHQQQQQMNLMQQQQYQYQQFVQQQQQQQQQQFQQMPQQMQQQFQIDPQYFQQQQFLYKQQFLNVVPNISNDPNFVYSPYYMQQGLYNQPNPYNYSIDTQNSTPQNQKVENHRVESQNSGQYNVIESNKNSARPLKKSVSPSNDEELINQNVYSSNKENSKQANIPTVIREEDEKSQISSIASRPTVNQSVMSGGGLTDLSRVSKKDENLSYAQKQALKKEVITAKPGGYASKKILEPEPEKKNDDDVIKINPNVNLKALLVADDQ